jgi:aspartyl-tRNA(Asn)/glutamyl-tRNA(Gln) amidotransferase subunit A
MHDKTLAELSTALHDGDVSSRELTRHMLQRIKSHDAQLNSFISVTEEVALEQADAADARIAAGR